MKIASSLSDIITSGLVHDSCTPNGEPDSRLLSVEELAFVHGGSGKGSIPFADELGELALEILRPPARELGQYLGDQTREALRSTPPEPAPPPPPPPPQYEAPIQSGEANMSMAGGGVGHNGTPVQDNGSHLYYLPPDANMSSAGGNETGY